LFRSRPGGAGAALRPPGAQHGKYSGPWAYDKKKGYDECDGMWGRNEDDEGYMNIVVLEGDKVNGKLKKDWLDLEREEETVMYHINVVEGEKATLEVNKIMPHCLTWRKLWWGKWRGVKQSERGHRGGRKQLEDQRGDGD
jgi:hypothetical protein